MFRRKLACSFCRRSEAEVARLVAGPRVYICDRCAAEAVRIMNEADGKHEATSATTRRNRRSLHAVRHQAVRRRLRGHIVPSRSSSHRV